MPGSISNIVGQRAEFLSFASDGTLDRLHLLVAYRGSVGQLADAANQANLDAVPMTFL
jgi:hypothetical protein